MGYTTTAIKGISWVGLFRVSTRGISFLRTVILARILTPAQFGVFGIASLILALLEIFTETGINVFLIQKRQKIDKYINTAWVVSIARGIIISGALLLSSQTIAIFFNSPSSLFVLRPICLVPLIRGFLNPSTVLMQKDLRFKFEFGYRFIIFAFESTIAIIFSLITKSALGIVYGMIAGAVLELIMSHVLLSPKPKPIINKAQLRQILGQGKWITGAGIFQFLFRQGDDAVVGKLLGETQLGYYQVAYKISTLPITEITDVFGRVTFPLYVKFSSDRTRLAKAFVKTTMIIALLALAMGSLIFVFAQQLVQIALGSNWLIIVPAIQVLAVFGVIQAISNSIHSLLLALGKNSFVTAITAVAIIGMGIVIFPLTSVYGIVGTSAAALFGSLISLPFVLVGVWYFLTRKN